MDNSESEKTPFQVNPEIVLLHRIDYAMDEIELLQDQIDEGVTRQAKLHKRLKEKRVLVRKLEEERALKQSEPPVVEESSFTPLTDLELSTLDDLASSSSKIRLIIGHGPQADNDWAEAAHNMHILQNMILSQAAARAYPDKFRLMGNDFSDL